MASRPVSLKLLPRSVMKSKALTTFPARVLGTNGVLVTKANGTYTFALDPDNAPTVIGLVIGTDVQAQDADLQALADNTGTGLWAVTAAGTGHVRTLTAPAAGITVTNGDGVSGNPTLVLANDLAAYEGLSSTGLVARTADGAAAARTLTAPAAGITVSNGGGVAGDPTLVLANDLAALEGLGSTGFAARTATDTWAQRTLSAATGLVWTNPAGVAGNPSINFDITSLTADATPDAAADYLLTYDASAGAYKKALISAAVTGAAAGVTSLNGQTGALTLRPMLGGRVSASSSTALPTADILAATTIYFHPGSAFGVPIYDGSQWVPRQPSGVLSLALDSNSGHTGYHQVAKLFTVFLYWTGSVVGIGTGPAWTSTTDPGSGAGTSEEELYQGIFVNKNTITLRIGTSSGDTVSVSARQAIVVGGFLCGADGQTEDSLLHRYVASLYDLAERPMLLRPSTDSWTYSTFGTWQQWAATAGNKVDLIQFAVGQPARARAAGLALNSTATVRTVAVGIGIGSTSVNSATESQPASMTSTSLGAPRAVYAGFLGRGYNSIVPLEQGAGADTNTFFGDAGAAGGLYQACLEAWAWI
jgi:hypothetical protein